MTRTELINILIRHFGYKSYLEIGVNTPKQPGYNFATVHIDIKEGVDPNPDAKATFVMTSDEFFDKKIKELDRQYDIVFVDGLHLSEQAYRDIVNSLNHLSVNGAIVVHDCNPTQEITQRRERASSVWHGDVWKAILKLRMERPDLNIYTVDTDEGCAVIQKGSQELFVPPAGQNINSFQFLDAHRKEILHLTSRGIFKKKMGVMENWSDRIKRLFANI